MWLARSRVGVLSGFLLCASAFCQGQNSSPATAADCKRSINKADYESRTDGPFVQDVGYSNVLRSCIVITRQGFPTTRHRISITTWIVKTETRETVWEDGRFVRQGRADVKYPALEAELKKLDIELAPR